MFIDFSKAFDSIPRGKMEQILLACGLPKEIITATMKLYKNTKAIVRLPNGDTDFFTIVDGVLQGDTLASYVYNLFSLRTTNLNISNNRKWFHIKKRQEADNDGINLLLDLTLANAVQQK